MLGTLSGMLIAPLDRNVEKGFCYDSIGRVLTNDKGSRFICIDMWPIKEIWKGIAYIVHTSWTPADGHPEITDKESLQIKGRLAIEVESFHTHSEACEKQQKIDKSLGYLYTANTSQGATEACRFVAVPASPVWYSHSGIIRILPLEQPTTH